ncbi:MAG: phosphate signaling complex protein PhoU [Eubacteriaceae bacterium]|nr:phosphate signaling complex protein PhoU [Eubacteriaceae bacterium]
MRKHFDKELDKLHKEILLMSSITEEMLKDAIIALVKKDIELAKDVIKRDDLVDAKEIYIQELCVRIIATQQPVATDLRLLASAFKILTNLERIADHAVNICEITIFLKDEIYIKTLIDIPKMSEVAIDVVKLSIDAFVNQDISGLPVMIEKEIELDHLFRRIYKELTSYMIKDSSNIKQASRFIFVASYLERVGDHATNIFESVHYIVTGQYKDFKDFESNILAHKKEVPLD